MPHFPVPDGFTLPVAEHDILCSSNESNIKTTERNIRCVVCSTTIAVQKCHIIQPWDTHTWNTLKAKKCIPPGSGSIDQEVGNTISMCPTHTTSFERYYFFIQYIPGLRQYLFVNHSGVDDPMLTPFHGKSIKLDVKDHVPFQSLLLIHEQRVRGFWSFAQPETDISVHINQELEVQARCNSVAMLLRRLTSGSFNEVSNKIIEIINRDVNPKTPPTSTSTMFPSTFISSQSTLRRPKVTLKNPDGVELKLGDLIKPRQDAFSKENMSINKLSLEEEKGKRQKMEEKVTSKERDSKLKKLEGANDGELPLKALRHIIDPIYSYAIAADDAEKTTLIASLLRKIVEQTSTKIQDDSLKDFDGKPIVGGQLARKHLLNRCQEDFKRGWAVNESISTEEDKVSRRQYLGLLRLMAELYKLQMLTERVIHESIKFLLSKSVTEEVCLESVCTLFLVAGRELDRPIAHGHIDVYLAHMSKECIVRNISSRTRSMVQDVIALRHAGWDTDQVKLDQELDFIYTEGWESM